MLGGRIDTHSDASGPANGGSSPGIIFFCYQGKQSVTQTEETPFAHFNNSFVGYKSIGDVYVTPRFIDADV